MYSNVDPCNHPAIISIFWMCSHLGFFSYILSFHSLRSRRLEVMGAREKGRERGRHVRGTQAKFSSLMCMTFHQIPVHSPSAFQLTMRKKRKTGTTKPFYLYTIHEHSMMHMIHELRTFVDSRTSQMPKSHNWHKFITWSGMFLSIKKLLCSLFLPEQSVYCIHLIPWIP